MKVAGLPRPTSSIVSSGLGFGPVPRYATYGATKAFSIAFGEALHTELRRAGVAVNTLCPGPVASEFFAVAGPQPPQRVIPRAMWATPDAVARSAIAGLERNRRVVVPREVDANGDGARRSVPTRAAAGGNGPLFR